MVLRKGSRGRHVEKLVKQLIKYGHWEGPVVSVYDIHVARAVASFQSRHLDHRTPPQPLKVDSIAGPLTLRALLTGADADAGLAATQVHLHARHTLARMPRGGSKRGRAALKAALNEMRLGACEIGHNNAGHWVEKYLRRDDKRWSWCAGFVSWCYSSHPSGLPKGLTYTLGARHVLAQFRKLGWAYKPSDDNQPQPGDVVVWARGTKGWQGHVGIVVTCDDGLLRVIEGNKGKYPAQVRIFEYNLDHMSRVLGFGRVPF